MTTACSLTALFAQTGQALSLNGTSGYMRVTDNSALDIDAGESFSLTLWLRTTSTAGVRLVSKRVPAGGTNPGYEMITQSSVGAYGINLRSADGTNAGPPFGTSSITDGNWHHLAMVVNAGNGTATIYVDGIQQRQSNSGAIGTESFANVTDLLIGTNVGENVFYSGLFDDIRIWSAALSTSTIIADAEAVIDGSENNLVAAWDFEEVAGGVVPDLKGTHPGKLVGGAITVTPDGPMIISSADLEQRDLPVGMGESDEGIVAIKVATVGDTDPIDLTALTFNLNGTTNIGDVSQIKVYYTGGSERFAATNLFGSASPTSGELTVVGAQTLTEGANYFWIAADVTANAGEGNVLDVEGVSVTANDEVVSLATTTEPGGRLIIMEHQLLFSGGDFNTVNWRIPAITTATDGSLIVMADARRDQAGDLPNHIDPLARRSTDNGATWSQPVALANLAGNVGAGDVAVLRDQNTDDIIAIFPADGGFFQSSVGDKLKTLLVRSSDNGVTWSDPVEITDMVNLPSWSGAFPSSGSMNQTRSGRIIHTMVVRPDPTNNIDVYMIYSDDGGATWAVKPNPISLTGNEAKILELDNENLMANLRNGSGRRQIVVSEDGGDTWGTPTFQPELISPGVNGDFIRYTSVRDSFDQSRLLFSVASDPNSRNNLTIFLSYDEGETWGTSKVVNPGPTGYSTLTILEDGSIGCFYENGEHEAYQMYFARFTLDWLSDGNDSYEEPVSTEFTFIEPSSLKLSPNPTAGATTLSFGLLKGVDLSATLMDNSGRVVKSFFDKSFVPGLQTENIDLSGLPNGLYYLDLRGGGQRHLEKVIKVE